MGHLSSINGCGVRPCDSLWEKYTNVSRDLRLSVRAEEVSLPKDWCLFTRGSDVMMSSCFLTTVIVQMGTDFIITVKQRIQDVS